jgi:hypothetical protein
MMDEDMKLLMDKIDALEKQVATLVRLHTPEGKREAEMADLQRRAANHTGIFQNPWGGFGA